MIQSDADPKTPNKLPDPVLGVETNEQVTNSEDQQIVDDVVAETGETTSTGSDDESTVTEKEKRDLTDIN